jgi:pyridoxine/pyridoxamine 5'-phosphate oxidase
MFETSDEIEALQQLLDASFDRSSSHLTSIMTPQRRLTAAQLVADIPAPAVLNIATVTARGEPRLCAVDGHFLHGHWQFSTAAESPKARQLDARAAISAGYTPRDGYGVFCHGTAARLRGEEQELFRRRSVEVYGQSIDDWGTDIAIYRIDPHWIVAFAFPEPADDGAPGA